MMARHDGTGTFVPVGRIGIGRVFVTAGSDDVARVRVTIPIRNARGSVEPFPGAGEDLVSAIADALAPLSDIPFSIVGTRTAAGRSRAAHRTAGVLVQSLEAATPRHATGHATAEDEATAITAAVVRGLAVGGWLRRKFLPAGARDVEASTERIVQGLGRLLVGTPLAADTVGAVRELVAHELHRFGEGQAIIAAHCPDPTTLLTRFDAEAALEQPAGEVKASDTRTTTWWEWFPGLDNDARPLRDVLAELPAAPPMAIPWIVRLFENDQGWLRLHGAVNLAHHDMIHVLLGRGLLDQDEAFVIGFTMGCTKSVSRLERWFFKCAVSRLYPEPYRIARKMLVSYDLGLEAGREFGIRNLHLRLHDGMLDRPLGEIRRALAIDTKRLRQVYAREREMLPGTLASLRLPAAS